MSEPIFNLNRPYAIAIRQQRLPTSVINCKVFNFNSFIHSSSKTNIFLKTVYNKYFYYHKYPKHIKTVYIIFILLQIP